MGRGQKLLGALVLCSMLALAARLGRLIPVPILDAIMIVLSLWTVVAVMVLLAYDLGYARGADEARGKRDRAGRGM